MQKGGGVGLKNMQQVKIKIPINTTGEFDLEVQKEIAKKFQAIQEIKGNITERLNSIAAIRVNVMRL
jgi:hypothetical protein